MMHHGFCRLLLIGMTVAVSGGRLHAHAVGTPDAVTGEVNRCLMMVRVAATRRAAQPQKAARHVETRRQAGVGHRPFDAALQTQDTLRDIRVEPGERLMIALTLPATNHLPSTR
jgi:ribosomal protein L2